MFDLKMFNKYSASRGDLLQKALTTASGVGGALIAQSLETEITNTIIRLSPELAMITKVKIDGNLHEFNRLTALPKQGGAMGEAAATPQRNSTYARSSVKLKVIRRKGQVTEFQADASAKIIDSIAIEMENNITQHVYDLIDCIIWGNADSNVWEFSGLDRFISTNRTINARYGVTLSSLKTITTMIDKNTRKGGKAHRKAIMMSPEMLTTFSDLLTNVRINQGISGAGLVQVEISGGHRLFAFRDVPIIETTSLSPQDVMTAVGTATNAAGGTIPDDDYFFKIAPITANGEELAVAADQTSAGGNTSTITLSWTAFPGAYRYKIYCKDVVNTEVLVCEIPAFLYDVNGKITGDVTTVTFSTNPNAANPTISAPAELTGITASVPVHMQADIAYEQEATHGVPETIILWDMDSVQGLGELVYTNRAGSNFDGLVTTKPLDQFDDWIEFLIKSYPALADRFEGSSVMIRGVRAY